MITYPLDELHLEALRWACGLSERERRLAIASIGVKQTLCEEENEAVLVLSSPASAASLVRDLLARAGAPALLVNTARVLEYAWPVRIYYMASDVPDVDPDDEDDDRCFEVSEANVPRLISALANLASGDKDGAMRALREVGR